MKVVLLDNQTLPGDSLPYEEKIFADAGIEFVVCECRTEQDIIDCAKDADGLLTVYAPLTRKIIEQLPKAKVFVRYGIGYDVIDVQAASDHGIAVCNLPTYCIPDVALHTIAMIMNANRKIAFYDRSVRRGEWDPGKGYEMHRPDQLTLGFLGFGNIARMTAELIKPLGFKLIAYDPYLSADRFAALNAEKVELEKLLALSDVISLHTPVTAETRHIINQETIAAMKPGVTIVNTSRGELVDTAALIKGLESGHIQAACLDVLEHEPLADEHKRLLDFENVTLSPHTAYFSHESAIDQHCQVAESAVAVLRGEKPANIVNRRELGLV
mgnify:CR=1 FL=1